jgi:hypothetical protein
LASALFFHLPLFLAIVLPEVQAFKKKNNKQIQKKLKQKKVLKSPSKAAKVLVSTFGNLVSIHIHKAD